MNSQIDHALQEDDEAQNTFDRVLIDIICNATIAIPIAASMVGIVLAIMASDQIWPPLLALWLVAYITASFSRFWALRYWLPSRKDLNDQRKLGIATYFSLATGAMVASSVPLFFENYSAAEQGVQTIMILSMCVATIVSVAGYRPHLLGYAAPPTIALGIAWSRVYTLENSFSIFILGVLTFMFLWVITRFSNVLKNSLYRSYENQQEQRKLNRQLSIALQDSEAANESKNLFFASASHDLRQPIHTLSLLTAALSMRKMDEESEEILQHIDVAVDNLSTQMDSMLDIARLDAGVFEAEFNTLNCTALLKKMYNEYSQLANKKSLDMRLEAPEQNIFVNSDAELLERVLRNLLDNATKYTPDGSIVLKLTHDKEFVYVDVIDTGVGIGDKEKLKIFDEFYQIANPSRDRSRGLGLGLSIVRRITDLLNISLDFESQQNIGSTFTLSIPLSSEILAPAKNHSERIEYDRNKTLLCIDDETEVLNAMRILLGNLGYSVLTATTTKDALKVIEEHTPDVVLADFRLAENHNGIDAIHKIRERIANIPAILISGDTGKDRLQQAATAGIPLLSKPIRVDSLEETIFKISN